MKLIREFPEQNAWANCIVTIGNFDGLHLGHQSLIRQCQMLAHRGKSIRPVVVMSFDPGPRAFFQPHSPPAKLYRTREKLALLRKLGVDTTCLLRFNAALAAMSADEFAQRLKQHFDARAVVVGDDFRYGKSRAGDILHLRDAGEKLGYDVVLSPTVEAQGQRVSSTAIRQALYGGDFLRAQAMLGRPYTMSGRVGYGEALGRTLGYPTANISVGRRRSPLHGIYAVRVHGIPGCRGARNAVASLGTRPTVQGKSWILEVHVFDYDGRLYGALLQVEFVAHIRDEQKFADLDALTAQMHHDAAQARSILEQTTAQED